MQHRQQTDAGKNRKVARNLKMLSLQNIIGANLKHPDDSWSLYSKGVNARWGISNIPQFLFPISIIIPLELLILIKRDAESAGPKNMVGAYLEPYDIPTMGVGVSCLENPLSHRGAQQLAHVGLSCSAHRWGWRLAAPSVENYDAKKNWTTMILQYIYSKCMPACLSVCLSVCPSVCLYVRMYACVGL